MSVIIWPKTEMYSGLTREELINKFKIALKGKCISAYFFGSFASGNDTPESDIDILVVANTERPFIERARQYNALWDIFPRLDLLVYTPQEFAQLKKDDFPGFRKSMMSNLLQIL